VDAGKKSVKKQEWRHGGFDSQAKQQNNRSGGKNGGGGGGNRGEGTGAETTSKRNETPRGPFLDMYNWGLNTLPNVEYGGVLETPGIGKKGGKVAIPIGSSGRCFWVGGRESRHWRAAPKGGTYPASKDSRHTGKEKQHLHTLRELQRRGEQVQATAMPSKGRRRKGEELDREGTGGPGVNWSRKHRLGVLHGQEKSQPRSLSMNKPIPECAGRRCGWIHGATLRRKRVITDHYMLGVE